MALRAGNVFRFIFDAADQALIKPGSVTADDVHFASMPQIGQAYPQALRIRLMLNDPASVIELRPLGPGELSYRSTAGTAVTAAKAVPGNYAALPTTGTLRLDLTAEAQRRFVQLTGFPVAPTRLWYGPVRLTSDFLFSTLGALSTRDVHAAGKNVRKGHPDWSGRTVAGFLNGRLTAPLAIGGTAAADAAATLSMPAIVADATGAVEILVTAAARVAPFDGLARDYEVPAGVRDDDPAHPANGAIPARLVYRALRQTPANLMIDAAPGTQVPDAVLAGDPVYRLIRFTRIWKPERDCSVHFPSQIVQVAWQSPASLPDIDQRLPCHGLLWLSLTTVQALNAQIWLALSTPSAQSTPTREMYWLDGSTPNAWREPATTALLSYTLLANGSAHVIARRRMGQEVIYDREDRPNGQGCTYFSMRRAIRALVNNRIAGGRLNFEVFTRGGRTKGSNTPATRALLRETLGQEAATRVLDGRPSIDGLQGPGAKSLIPVFEAFFPTDATPVAGMPVPTQTFTMGRVAYLVWQTAWKELMAPATTGNFATEWLGGGGPGALVATKLAGGYAIRPGETVIRRASESDGEFAQRIIATVLEDELLEPGAPLQFWDQFADYKRLGDRTLDEDVDGHSPIFLRYEGPPGQRTGMLVLDQFGKPSQCTPRGMGDARRLSWFLYTPDLWIAANWAE